MGGANSRSNARRRRGIDIASVTSAVAVVLVSLILVFIYTRKIKKDPSMSEEGMINSCTEKSKCWNVLVH